ncbi:transducin beta-like protein 3 [Palaemon carinicauda]|uniref:transducin beta-like protein 3 n=1 Tax=Palaemon carinicauda TaxID=392227 RepID=UPI0035B5A824
MSKLFLKVKYAAEAKYDAYFTGKRIQVTKDGKSLLCENENNVGIVAFDTGKVSSRISCKNDVITCVSLSPNNSSLVVALRSTSVQQYGWPDLELQRTFRSYHRGPVTVMDWDASSTLLITGGADSSARVWDLHQKFCTHSLKGASGVFGVVMFHPDLTEKPYVYGAVANNIHIWALAAGSSSLVKTLEGHHSGVTALQLTDDRTHLISSGLDRVIILWDLKALVSKRIVPVLESLSGIILQPKGTLLPGAQTDDHIYALTVGDKGIPSVWQVDTGRQVWKSSQPLVTSDREGASLINQLSYSHTHESVIFTTFDNSILLAKIDSLNIWKQLSGYNDQILDAVFVGTGETHLAVATNSPQIRIYKVNDFSVHLTRGHTANVYSLTRHPTKHDIFASSAHDSSICIWELKTDGSAVCIAMAKGHTQSVGSVTFSQGFMVSGSSDMCMKRWDVDVDKILGKSASDGAHILQSTYTVKAHDKDINSLCISVNHKLVASGSQDKTAKIWDSNNLSLLGVLRGHRRGVWCVQFSPVEEVLATSSGDGTIKIWALSDFSNALTLEGHGVSVMRLSWISHGQQLLSIGSEGLLKMWTVKTRQCVFTADKHEDRLWALAVSQDEMKVVTGGEDASIVIWKDVTQEEKDKELEEAARLASEEQTLANLIQDKKWGKALAIAIRLNQPFRGLKIIKELLEEDPSKLKSVIRKLRHDQLVTLLEFVSQWNAKTKNSREAQSILNVVLTSQTPEDLEGMRGWNHLLEGLIPYTDRHFRRLTAMHQSSYILQYMSACLSLGESEPLGSDVELLRIINENPIEPSDDNEDEGVELDISDEDDEDDNVPNSVKEALKDSIMEVGETEEMSDSESSSTGNLDDLVESSKMSKDNERMEISQGLDGLDSNFIMEAVEASNSEDEGNTL